MFVFVLYLLLGGTKYFAQVTKGKLIFPQEKK